MGRVIRVKGREILGLLLNVDHISGEVTDLVTDNSIQKVTGLVITKGDEEEIIPWLPLTLNKGQLHVLEIPATFAAPAEGYRLTKDLIGQEISMDNGSSGYLGDLLIELPEGKIGGVEVSRGFVGDLLDGRFLHQGEFFLLSERGETK
ncbi:MAG: hypothetical protein PWQ91_830 [Eubacteriales bacterium]|nr:hypothetical protein [Eubacteriales bacterium]MDN5363769.1 hypothetical protein [Eubacteriales bacterium]